MVLLITVLSSCARGISGYEGVFCHINTDECASQPCLNNGKCVDKINSFHCECPKGEEISGNVKVCGVSGVKVSGYWSLQVSLYAFLAQQWAMDKKGCKRVDH